LTVINDILDFSKIEAGKLQFEPAPFPLRDSLADALRTLALRAQQKGLELACDVGPDVPDVLVGDLGRLRQVLVNLVGNAIKFTERGEVVVSVAVVSGQLSVVSDEKAPASSASSLTTDHSSLTTLRFEVRDTGIGIAADKQALIFEPFEQVDGSVSRRYGGTGLGLAISTQLVSLMGGRLEVESNEGSGSRFHFTVRLPVAPGPAHVELPSIDGLRVLVVDDNATHRHILEEMLRNWRMSPTVIGSAREALAELRRATEAGEPYPLLLVDAVMPSPDGLALVEDVKSMLARQPGQAGPTIMMLAPAGKPGSVERCRQVGASASLLKPIKQSELLNTILDLLSTVPARRAAPAGAAEPPPSWRRPLRVLLAEDNLVNQKVTVRVLEKQGHSVAVAGNGHEAVEAVAHEAFDLVLMDIQMPGMGGIEATASIRSREAGPGRRVPIIAMTAHVMKGDRERCLAAGMDGYVSKPIQARELQGAIDEVLRRLGRSPGGEKPAEVEKGPPVGPDELDRAVALERVGGDLELLRELALMFIAEAPSWLEGLVNAVTAGDAAALKRVAHTLKGAVGTFGAKRASDAALRLEELGRKGNLAEAPAALAEAQEAVARLLRALAELASPTDVFDEAQALAQMQGDRAFFREAVELFLASRVREWASLEVAVVRRDAPGVERLAHRVKGQVGIFFARPAMLAAQGLEVLGQKCVTDRFDPGLRLLGQEVDRLTHALRAWLEQASAPVGG
jgi:CheY-like chemotaxis protein/HPt (histidine-containing phosphotransfer) domain-containing protein